MRPRDIHLLGRVCCRAHEGYCHNQSFGGFTAKTDIFIIRAWEKNNVIKFSSKNTQPGKKKGFFIMKTVGIIAEYNPFHHGHLYQIRQLKSRTGADFVVAAMSGDFVQRGKPAIYDKYTRTRMALNSGVDLVLELPVCFATGSAEDFAACGVALLERLGVVDVLGFGSESGDCQKLFQVASVLAEEPNEYVLKLQNLLKQGVSFPAARAAAIEHCYGDSLKSLLLTPNNILAIEYLKALIRRDSPIKPVTVRRIGQGYHDTAAAKQEIFASASAIRKAIRENNYAMVRRQLPQEVLAVLQNMPDECPFPEYTDEKTLSGSPMPVFSDDFSELLNSRLLNLAHQEQENPFGVYADMAPELARRLQKNLLNFDSFSGRVMQLKTRSYTYTRISRALLHLLLGITAEQTLFYREQDYVCYARILGFRRQSRLLLSQISRNSSLPLITKTADAHKKLDAGSLAMLQMDFYASHLYQSLVFSRSGKKMNNEYTQSVIIL